jgi:hypothetical protein
MDDRYLRFTPQADYHGRTTPQDYTRDHGGGRDYAYSSARDYAASGEYDRREYDQRRMPQQDDGGPSHRPYGSDGYDRGPNPSRVGGYRSPGGYRDRYGRPQDDRGFLARAGDEVRSWFGDEDAEHRREMDQRHDAQYSRGWDSPYDEDGHYHAWRRERIAELDRDYAEYRRENADRFHREFTSFRDERRTQRSSLNDVMEHMEVLGSDGEHVGTVDKVRGDRILLTKNDRDADGHHHSIPSRWLESVDPEGKKVMLRKTAEEAQAHWRDEERNMVMFRDEDREQAADNEERRRSYSRQY